MAEPGRIPGSGTPGTFFRSPAIASSAITRHRYPEAIIVIKNSRYAKPVKNPCTNNAVRHA
jgi:hypothetical protein